MSKCQKTKKKVISSQQWLLVFVFWDVVAVELLIVFLPSNFLKFITQVNTDFIKSNKACCSFSATLLLMMWYYGLSQINRNLLHFIFIPVLGYILLMW